MIPSGRILAALVLLAATGPAMDQAGASFVASPMEHHLQVPQGAEGSTRIVIRNTADYPLTLKLYLTDSRFDASGKEQDVDAGAVPRSCAPWIQLQDVLLEIAPGEARATELRLIVPEDAAGSFWTKVYIEETGGPKPVHEKGKERSYQVLMRQRVGVRIFQDVPGTQMLDAAVTDVQVSGGSGKDRELSVQVKNQGNSLLRCEGRLEIRDPQGEVSEVIPLGSKGRFWIFPGGHRDLRASTSMPLSPGTYTALAVVDFGGEHLVAGEQIFQVASEGPLTGAEGR